MKKKIVIVNFLMSLTVLTAMLFQTLHSYEHVYKQLTEKQCKHHTSANQKQITHFHDVESNCPICHFTFSTFIIDEFRVFLFQKIEIAVKPLFVFTQSASVFFKGSLFALRAPPALF